MEKARQHSEVAVVIDLGKLEQAAGVRMEQDNCQPVRLCLVDSLLDEFPRPSECIRHASAACVVRNQNGFAYEQPEPWPRNARAEQNRGRLKAVAREQMLPDLSMKRRRQRERGGRLQSPTSFARADSTKAR